MASWRIASASAVSDIDEADARPSSGGAPSPQLIAARIEAPVRAEKWRPPAW